MKNLHGIDHIGVTVPDIEQATTFFKQAFGAKIAYDNQKPSDQALKGPDTEKTLGLNEGAQVVHMRMISFENSVSIELFEFKNTEQRDPAIVSDFGVQHFAYYVEDIQKASASFTEAGGDLLNDPGELMGNVEKGTGNFVYGRTPWGMIIELVSYDPNEIDYPDGSEAKRYTP